MVEVGRVRIDEVDSAGGSDFAIVILDVRMEGLTLRVEDVERSIESTEKARIVTVEIDKAPQFA